jgi:integrase
VLDRAELHALIRLIGEARGWDADQLASAITASRRNEAKALGQCRAEAKELELDTQGAPLHDLRIHDLRRTLGSWQAVQGASLPIIGKSLGHKTATATQIYARLNLDPIRQSMQAAAAALLAQAHSPRAGDADTPPAAPPEEP